MKYEIDKSNPESRSNKRPNYTLRRWGAAGTAAFALSIVGVGAHIIEHKVNGPRFSDRTKVWVAQPGQGLDDAAAQVEGISRVDTDAVTDRIEALNEEALSDGLQQYEGLDIPESVKP